MLYSVMAKIRLILISSVLPLSILSPALSEIPEPIHLFSKPISKSTIKPVAKSIVKPIIQTVRTFMSDYTVTNSDRGKTVTLKAGQSLILRLNENPTTGYRWMIPVFDAQLIQLMDDRFEPTVTANKPINKPIMGAGGQRILVLQANRPGTIHLNLENKQSWNLNSPSAESFALTVHITE
jgi:inhibitor of cysteine peptidase